MTFALNKFGEVRLTKEQLNTPNCTLNTVIKNVMFTLNKLVEVYWKREID